MGMLLHAWRRVLRAFGNAHFIREGIRARILDRLRPWQRETDERFVVPFFGFDYDGRFSDAQDHMVYYRGGYENPELQLLATIASEIDECVALDIGTHTGQHMLMLASFCRQVYAFEPMPESFAVAKGRLERNGIGNVEILNFGLGTEDAEIPYYWDPSNLNRMAGSFVAEHAHLQQFGKLQVRSGDDWAREAGVRKLDLVKIDVEGFEAEVLMGLRNLLTAEPFILLEISWTAFDRITAAGGLERILPFAFDIYQVRSGRTALVFDFARFELIPLDRIERPERWGYNVLIVPHSRPKLRGLQRRIRPKASRSEAQHSAR